MVKNLMGDVQAGKKWKEKGCDHVVTITKVSDDFATCTMVAFESECCLSSAPVGIFLEGFEPYDEQ